VAAPELRWWVAAGAPAQRWWAAEAASWARRLPAEQWARQLPAERWARRLPAEQRAQAPLSGPVRLRVLVLPELERRSDPAVRVPGSRVMARLAAPAECPPTPDCSN